MGDISSPGNGARDVLRRIGLMSAAWFVVAIIVFTTTGGRANPADADTRTTLAAGETVWRQHDCQACHSLYGLGGHLGMDLTNLTRDRDGAFIRMTLHNGRNRMPSFDFDEGEVGALLSYFEALNASAESPLRGPAAPWFGRF